MDNAHGRRRNARHGLDGGDAGDADTEGVRRAVAYCLVWAGRILLIVVPIAVIGCRLTKQRWVSAPLDAGISSHWIPTTTMVLLVIFGVAAPLLLLPITSPALTQSDGESLQALTVLGNRKIDLEAARVWLIYIPGRGPGLRAAILRDRKRSVIVAASELWVRNDLNLGSTHHGAAGTERTILRVLAGVFVLLGDVLVASIVLTLGPGLAGIVT